VNKRRKLVVALGAGALMESLSLFAQQAMPRTDKVIE